MCKNSPEGSSIACQISLKQVKLYEEQTSRNYSLPLDSSVNIATGYGLDGRVQFPTGARPFRPTLGPTQPAIQKVSGALSAGVKRSMLETDDSPSSGAEVNNGGAIPPVHHTSSYRGA
jgi:hypothetical protein